MATRRRKTTATKRKRSTRKGQKRTTARRAYMSKRNAAPKRRRRRAKKNPPYNEILFAAAGGAAAGIVSKYVVPMLPAGAAQQYGGPALQIALGAFISMNKATKAYKEVGLGMVAVAASGLIDTLIGGATPAPITASQGWMPASAVQARFLNPPSNEIPLNSFLADIVVPS